MNAVRFDPRFRIERLSPDLVFLIGENEQHVLSGHAYYVLAPFLDGSYSEAELFAAVASDFTPMQIQYTLRRLRQRGYLAADGHAVSLGQTVRIVAINQLPIDDLSSLLNAQGINVIDTASSDDAALDIIVTDDYLALELESFSRTRTRPYLLVKPTGSMLWIGPIFEANSSPCWQCLAWRIQYNTPVETFLTNKLEYRVVSPQISQPHTLSIGFSLAADAVFRWLSGERMARSQILSFDTHALSTRWHLLTPRPHCPLCGTQAGVEPIPITLRSIAKAADRNDAGYRSQSAEAVIQEYQHHISPICGIVTHLTRIASAPHVFVYASGHNKSRSFEHWQNFRANIRSQSAGKGTTDTQAKASALCEAIERYSGLFQGDESHFTASIDNVVGAVHPHDILLFSERQYANREQWNTTCPPHVVIPDPFDASRPIDWTPVWSLTHQRWRHVPTAMCYYDYLLPPDHVFCGSDSNGCAAGSSLEEAVLQGFLELVERDAVALWWENRLRRPALDLTTVDNPYLRQVEAHFAQIGRDLWVLDLTTDLAIPTFAAVSRRLEGQTEDIVLGFGAHLDPKTAVLRAVTELNQTLPAAMTDARGNYHSEAPWEIDWWQHTRIADSPYLSADVSQTLRMLSDYPVQDSSDLRDDVLWCVEQARQSGLEVLVLDQTRADSALPVARVIVPGLRHFWARYASGRLYDVPVKMGWLDSPTPEEALNERVMFL